MNIKNLWKLIDFRFLTMFVTLGLTVLSIGAAVLNATNPNSVNADISPQYSYTVMTDQGFERGVISHGVRESLSPNGLYTVTFRVATGAGPDISFPYVAQMHKCKEGNGNIHPQGYCGEDGRQTINGTIHLNASNNFAQEITFQTQQIPNKDCGSFQTDVSTPRRIGPEDSIGSSIYRTGRDCPAETPKFYLSVVDKCVDNKNKFFFTGSTTLPNVIMYHLTQDGDPILHSTTPYFTVTLAPGETHFYRLEATNNTGPYGGSNTITVTGKECASPSPSPSPSVSPSPSPSPSVSPSPKPSKTPYPSPSISPSPSATPKPYIVCKPDFQYVKTGQTVNFTAHYANLTNNIDWSAPGANPEHGLGSTFSTTFANPGQYEVVVKSGNFAKSVCKVKVTEPKPSYTPTPSPSASPSHTPYPSPSASPSPSPSATPYLVCKPDFQIAKPGETVKFSTHYGNLNNNIDWSAPGANPEHGLGDKFETSFSNPGLYTVNVKSGNTKSVCKVKVVSHETPSPSPSPSTSPSPTPTPTPSMTPYPTHTPHPSPSVAQCPAGKVSKVIDSTIVCVSQNQEQNQNQTQNNNQNQNVDQNLDAQGGTSSSSSSSGSSLNLELQSSVFDNPTFRFADARNLSNLYSDTGDIVLVQAVKEPQIIAQADSSITELPRTGLPLAALGLAGAFPGGLIFKKFSKKEESESANDIWTKRQIKKS